jgi:beta-glucanase (GH16 family)
MRLRHLREMVALAVVAAGGATVAQAQTWTQVWSDEFNGSNGAALSGSTWTYDTGGGGWGNNELQYYQAGTANVWQTGGYMQIQARLQSVGGYAYTSARAKTQGLRSFGPGDATPVKIEARIQGTQGQGLLPAFWTLGANIASVPWPGCGEIDIMEHVNTSADANMTLHWNNGGHVQQGFGTASVGSTFEQWHTYAITWTPSAITAVVDGVSRGSMSIANNVNSTEEFHWPHFLLANIAVGGNWPGNPNSSTTFPAYLNVDYIRYYTGSGTGTTPTPTPAPNPGTGAGTIVNRNSGKCVDANAAATANGTRVQQYTCNGTGAQSWVRTATSGGYSRFGTSNNANQVWDVAGTANGGLVQLWSYGGGTNQQWLPVSEGGGYYHFVARSTGKCLDVPGASTADGVQLQQYTCNGTAAQSFRMN